MAKTAYKVLILTFLSAIMVAYTNCGKKSELKFVSASQLSEGKVAAFERTVFQVTRANCASCHSPTSGNPTTPYHSAADAESALRAIEDTGKINWGTPQNSRLVVKIRDENHNCWSDCSQNAEEMLEAITTMSEMMEAEGESPAPAPGPTGPGAYISTTQSRPLQQELDDVANPQKSNTVRLNLEAAMLTPPMAKIDDPVRGTILTVPQTKQTTLLATDNTAGIAYMNFDVRIAGSYRVWMNTNAANANDNGFFVKFDNQTVQTFDPTINGGDYGWMLVPNSQRNLTVGRHTFELREKKDGTKVNSVIITADTTFNGVDVGSFVGATITFDLAPILKIPNVKLMIDIADYDPYSYKLLNPRIVSTSNIKVKNMRILLNNFFNPQNSAFTTVDKIVTPADPVVSPFSTVIPKDKGLSLDKLSFQFEQLAVSTGAGATGGTGGGPVVVDPAVSLASFRTTVYPVSRAQCIRCHTTQDPAHASNSAQIAHDTVVNEELVDFDSPSLSRLYRKVKVNRHNCGTTANCDMIADQFLQGIRAWGTARGN